ncbi:MAG: SDR family oxidoreductase [Asgard group archaeon]|nr:SDR family oxidoreductase [Asgard group archaeon]
MRNSTVLVTGGSSGIGLSIAVYLRYCGYKVYASSRNPKKNDSKLQKEIFLQQNRNKIPKKLRKQLDNILNEIKFVKLDITDNQSIDKCISKIESESEMVDILINNVGFSTFSSIEDNNFDQIVSMFNTNVIGPTYLTQKVLPKMREKEQGRIINISSMAGHQALPFMGFYAATKAAIMRLTEALHLECNQFNVKVSSLILGTFNTNFNANMINSNSSKSKEHNPVPKTSPYSTMGEKVWRFTESFFSGGTRPIKAARKTAKILTKRRPKAGYHYGRFNETVLNTLRKYGNTQFFLSLLNWMFKR